MNRVDRHSTVEENQMDGSMWDPFETIDPDFGTDRFATQSVGDNADPCGTVELATGPEAGALNAQDLDQIRQIRTLFSSAWEEGSSEPRVEDHIPLQIDAEARKRLVQELVLLDLQYRSGRDQSVAVEEYVSRLPEDREAIESAFVNRSSTVPRGYGSVTVPSRRRDVVPIQHPSDSSSRYAPMDFHARGGLGVVYVALDSELERVVALKEIAPEHGDKSRYQEKFVFEAQVTGSLEHPGIVPVYGLGRYDDQQPFYAMRFIEGRSLKDAIEQFHHEHPRLNSSIFYSKKFRALLRRLIDTCNAIHYANDRGVVHRDIKPANVMLGNYGETLVVDWGLAKLTESQSSTSVGLSGSKPLKVKASSVSGKGSPVGTPMYMSPEQARGDLDQQDRRSDVYSLGALLFNLITGQYAVEGSITVDVIKRVVKGRIRQLSDVVPAAPGALQSICRKAMALNPDDRYANAVELSEDIERWINSEQVQAHIGHEGMLERCGRLIRRHWMWAIPVAVALVVIATGALIAALLINGAKNETRAYKQEAVARYRDSRGAIDTWLVQSTDALQFMPGTEAVRQRLLELAADDYAKLASRTSEDPELELERGRATMRHAYLLQQQNEFPEARLKFEAARVIFGRNVADPTLQVRYRAEASNVESMLGQLSVEQNEIERATLHYELAISQLGRLVASSDQPLPRRFLAVALANAGDLARRIGDRDLAVERLNQALNHYASIEPIRADHAVHAAMTRTTLGLTHASLGAHDVALDHLDLAISEITPWVSAQPDHPHYVAALASAYMAKANSLQALGRDSALKNTLELALKYHRDLNGAFPEDVRYQQSLAKNLVNLGMAANAIGESISADAYLIEAHDLLAALESRFSGVASYREDLATCLDQLGQVRMNTQEDPTDAIRLYASAARLFEQLAGAAETNAILSYIERMTIVTSHHAEALSRQGDVAKQAFEDAISRFQQLIANDGGTTPSYADGLASVHLRYAWRLQEQDDPTRARSHFETARDTWMAIEQGRSAMIDHQLAKLLATCPHGSLRDIAGAEQLADRAVTQSPDNARYLTTKALVDTLAGRPSTAMDLLQQVKSIRGYWIDRDFFVLARAQGLLGQAEQASTTFEQGAAWMDQHRPFHEDLRRLRERTKDALHR